MNYQEFAARTLNGNPELTDLERLSNFLIGLAGETIEFYKVLFCASYLSDFQFAQEAVKEAGDVRWYIAAVHSALKIAESETEPSESLLGEALCVLSQSHAWENLQLRVGEILEMCKKHYFHKTERPRSDFIEALTELRATWFVLCLKCDLKPEEVEKANIEKLMKRYPNGFNAADSAARRDTQEAHQ